MELQAVELAAAVGGVEAGSQPDARPGLEGEGRLDMARRGRFARHTVRPDIERVRDSDAVDRTEPRHQKRERVDRPVVEWADVEKRLGAVVPVGDPADVGVCVAKSDRAEPTARE